MKSQPTTNRIVQGFLGYLSETNQSVLLPELTRELDDMVDIKDKSSRGVVTSVLPLALSQMSVIRALVNNFFHRDIRLTPKIDTHLLGGFTVKVGDWFVDASLARDIRELTRTVLT